MIGCCVVCVTDEEEDNEEVAGLLIDALVEANGLELLVEQMTKLNESVDEEAQAVNHALAIIEHAVEVRGSRGVLWPGQLRQSLILALNQYGCRAARGRWPVS